MLSQTDTQPAGFLKPDTRQCGCLINGSPTSGRPLIQTEETRLAKSRHQGVSMSSLDKTLPSNGLYRKCFIIEYLNEADAQNRLTSRIKLAALIRQLIFLPHYAEFFLQHGRTVPPSARNDALSETYCRPWNDGVQRGITTVVRRT